MSSEIRFFLKRNPLSLFKLSLAPLLELAKYRHNWADDYCYWGLKNSVVCDSETGSHQFPEECDGPIEY